MSKQEKEWMAQDDMRTLARAEEIKADKQRLSKAKQVGNKMAKEKMQEAKAMQKVAKMPVKKAAKTPVKKMAKKSAPRKKRY